MVARRPLLGKIWTFILIFQGPNVSPNPLNTASCLGRFCKTQNLHQNDGIFRGLAKKMVGRLTFTSQINWTFDLHIPER